MSTSTYTTGEIVEALLERLGTQDADGAAELFAQDIDWFVPGDPDDLPWTGQRSRREHVPEYLRTLWANFVPGESSADIDKILVDGDEAVIFSTFKHKVEKNGNTLLVSTAMRIVVDGGKIVKMHLYEDTAAVRDAFDV